MCGKKTRREVLASVSTGVCIGVAGCLSDSEDDEQPIQQPPPEENGSTDDSGVGEQVSPSERFDTAEELLTENITILSGGAEQRFDASVIEANLNDVQAELEAIESSDSAEVDTRRIEAYRTLIEYQSSIGLLYELSFLLQRCLNQTEEELETGDIEAAREQSRNCLQVSEGVDTEAEIEAVRDLHDNVETTQLDGVENEDLDVVLSNVEASHETFRAAETALEGMSEYTDGVLSLSEAAELYANQEWERAEEAFGRAEEQYGQADELLSGVVGDDAVPPRHRSTVDRLQCVAVASEEAMRLYREAASLHQTDEPDRAAEKVADAETLLEECD